MVKSTLPPLQSFISVGTFLVVLFAVRRFLAEPDMAGNPVPHTEILPLNVAASTDRLESGAAFVNPHSGPTVHRCSTAKSVDNVSSAALPAFCACANVAAKTILCISVISLHCSRAVQHVVLT